MLEPFDSPPSPSGTQFLFTAASTTPGAGSTWRVGRDPAACGGGGM